MVVIRHATGIGLLAFAVGIWLVVLLPALPGWRYLAALTVLAVSLRRVGGGVVTCFILGFTWHCWWGQQWLATEMPAAWEHQSLSLSGRVSGLPAQRVFVEGETQWRFDFEVSGASLGHRALYLGRPLTVRLSWYRAEPLVPGENWRLQVLLRRPRGLANPGGFDYRRWLLGRGIGATGKVVSGQCITSPGKPSPRLDQLRHWYQQQLQRHLGEHGLAPLVSALAIGDRQQFTPRQREVLAATGTGHLMVISGLHIGLSALSGFWLCYALAGLLPGWVQRGQATVMARCAALLVAFAYAALAGFALPTQRALIMLLLFLLARQSARIVASLRIWLLALAMVLLREPLAVAEPGFWLSFAAVGLLMAPRGITLPGGGRGRQALATQLRLGLGMAPLVALWSGQLSLLAPLINLLAIPWIGFLVVPVLLAALAVMPVHDGLAGLLLELGVYLLNSCWLLLDWAAATAGSLATLPLYPTPVAVAMAGLAILVYLLPRGLPGRMVWPLLLLPLCMPPQPRSDEFDLYVLDVGQGSAVVLRAGGRVLVYDTGPSYASGFNTGSAVLLPFLRSRGIAKVDRLVISHADTDHSGGAADLFAGINVQQWMAPGEIDGLGRPDVTCRAGQRWRWGPASFSVLHPSEPLSLRSNNQSCVLMVETAGSRFLLAGDIERDTEQALASTLGPALQADWLLVPHHGSAGSSSWAFAWFVSPAQAVVSAGYRNRFGHPAGRVVRRYRELGAEVIDTASGGALHFSAGDLGRPLHYRPYRWFYTGYWRNYPCQISVNATPSLWLANSSDSEGCHRVAGDAARSGFLW